MAQQQQWRHEEQRPGLRLAIAHALLEGDTCLANREWLSCGGMQAGSHADAWSKMWPTCDSCKEGADSPDSNRVADHLLH